MDQELPARPMLVGIEGTRSDDQRVLDHAQTLFLASLVLERSSSLSVVAPISVIAREDKLMTELYTSTELTFASRLRNSLTRLLGSSIIDDANRLTILSCSLAIRQQIEVALGFTPLTNLQSGNELFSWYSSHTLNAPWMGWLFGDFFSDTIRKPEQMYRRGSKLPARTVFRAGGINISRFLKDRNRSIASQMIAAMYEEEILCHNDITISILNSGRQRMLEPDLSGKDNEPLDSSLIRENSAKTTGNKLEGISRLFYLNDDTTVRPGDLSRTSVVIAALALAKFKEHFDGFVGRDKVHTIFMPLDRIAAYDCYSLWRYSPCLTHILTNGNQADSTASDDVKILGHDKSSLTFEITHNLSRQLGYATEP